MTEVEADNPRVCIHEDHLEDWPPPMACPNSLLNIVLLMWRTYIPEMFTNCVVFAMYVADIHRKLY